MRIDDIVLYIQRITISSDMSTEKEQNLERYLEMVTNLVSMDSRDDKNRFLVRVIGKFQQRTANKAVLDSFGTLLLSFYESEWDHQYLVCQALRAVGNKRRHDWSKDYFYIFILAGKFCFDAATNDNYRSLWQQEVQRHYVLEPHHRQHVKTGGEINRLDIEEMALDQLSRQVCQHKGTIDSEGMRKYRPKFEGIDSNRKLAWFEEYVEKHAQLMMDVYRDAVQKETGETTPNITPNFMPLSIAIAIIALLISYLLIKNY